MDKVVCRICGKESTRIYGAHLKSHGLTSEQYLKLYPGAPLYTELDLKQTTKNSGQHMKQEKYKKMFAEKIKGDKNPNSKTKTTEKQRKQRSPFSKDFIKYNSSSDALNFSRKVQKNIPSEQRPIKIEYYLSRGFSQEDAKKLLKERQSTFSLKKCIDKYGEEKGRERWLKRQEVWTKNYKKNNFSMISQKLFWSIYEKLENKNQIYFATLKNNTTDFSGGNNEYRLKLKNILIIPDFFNKNENKIIEFDGTYYHRNNPENKKRNLLRDKEIIDCGYLVHHVSESEYRSNPDKVLNECLKFLEILN